MINTIAKYKVFDNEFPWAKNYWHFGVGSFFQVQRMDESLLKTYPEDEADETGWIKMRQFYLLDEHGELVQKVGKVSDAPEAKLFKPSTWKYLGANRVSETVEMCLNRIGEQAHKVGYILAAIYLAYPKDDLPNRRLLIYKVPQGFTMKSWIEELYGREREALKQQLAAIDAV